MKEEAQRADRLAEAAKDATRGSLNNQKRRRRAAEEAEAAPRRCAGLAAAAARASSTRPLRRAPSSTPPTSPRNPGPPADLGAAFPRGAAARRRGGGLGGRREREPVQLELRAGAPSAPGAPLRFGWEPSCASSSRARRSSGAGSRRRPR